jgi:arsenite methyltransferase
VADSPDKWHRWLLDVRHGGDADRREQMLTSLHAIRDEVLDRAELQPADTVLDVGAGDGLIAFGALDRLGPDGRVIFADISRGLLEHCRSIAAAAGNSGRCDFVLAPADQLAGVPDRSVDVVTTRSVLIYVRDKAAAFAEFRRVLRPGGRISVHEPINVLMQECNPQLFFGYHLGSVAGIAAKLAALMDSIQPPAADPMLDFDDRDLVRLAEQAGFGEVSLDLRIEIHATRPPVAWDSFLRSSPNPHVPPLGDLLDQALTPGERAAFTGQLRPLVESGRGERRTALAYLHARESR